MLAHQKETKETKAVEVTGKALCFLGYLVFKVFWAIANPHEEKVEPAKKPKDTKNSDRGNSPTFDPRQKNLLKMR